MEFQDWCGQSLKMEIMYMAKLDQNPINHSVKESSASLPFILS